MTRLEPPRRTWTGHTAVLLCVVLALVPVGALHATAAGEVDPVAQTISDYVAVPGGYALLGLGTAALATAGLVLAGGIRRAGLPRHRPVAALLGSWSAAMVLVGLFPTNEPGTPAGVVAAVHRYAGAWAIAVLPLVGLLAARRARGAAGWAGAVPGLTAWSLAAGVLGVAFALVNLPLWLGVAVAVPLLGSVERVLFAVLLGLLLVLARAVREAVPAPAPVALAGGTA
ncbi:MAG TPA: DUF998 domain-containing protein [Pseudonocardia sp.]|nr:DUF998 domain-containing protein [Pseudonocardia sp.]